MEIIEVTISSRPSFNYQGREIGVRIKVGPKDDVQKIIEEHERMATETSLLALGIQPEDIDAAIAYLKAEASREMKKRIAEQAQMKALREEEMALLKATKTPGSDE